MRSRESRETQRRLGIPAELAIINGDGADLALQNLAVRHRVTAPTAWAVASNRSRGYAQHASHVILQTPVDPSKFMQSAHYFEPSSDQHQQFTQQLSTLSEIIQMLQLPSSLNTSLKSIQAKLSKPKDAGRKEIMSNFNKSANNQVFTHEPLMNFCESVRKIMRDTLLTINALVYPSDESKAILDNLSDDTQHQILFALQTQDFTQIVPSLAEQNPDLMQANVGVITSFCQSMRTQHLEKIENIFNDGGRLTRMN